MSAEYETPPELVRELSREFGPFDLDPCATSATRQAPRWYGVDEDGLSMPWFGRVFMNPPYGRHIGRWVHKARTEAHPRCAVVCLLPARTDAPWWHAEVEKHATLVRFLPGRVHFLLDGEPSGRPSFASVVVVFGDPKSVPNRAAP